MFLPLEGLFAEVLRRRGLWELLQREYHIIVTGPTTVTALLNSLQMGFRTLAIQKRSSEVWKLLGAVKTEFGKFGEVLEKTQKKLQEASHSIDSAAVRSRAIERKLRSVESVSAAESERWLNEANDEEKK
jgi:DNA recombination protein RmuC